MASSGRMVFGYEPLQYLTYALVREPLIHIRQKEKIPQPYVKCEPADEIIIRIIILSRNQSYRIHGTDIRIKNFLPSVEILMIETLRSLKMKWNQSKPQENRLKTKQTVSEVPN